METEIILVHRVVRLLSIYICMTLYSYPDMPINTYYLSFQPLSLFFCDHPTSTSRSPAHLSKDHLYRPLSFYTVILCSHWVKITPTIMVSSLSSSVTPGFYYCGLWFVIFDSRWARLNLSIPQLLRPNPGKGLPGRGKFISLQVAFRLRSILVTIE